MRGGSSSRIYGFYGLDQEQRGNHRNNYCEHHYRNENGYDRGLGIPTGYGTQFDATTSVPLARVEHAGLVRIVQIEEEREIGQ